MPEGDKPRVLLETSEVLRYVNAEEGHEAVGQLLEWVETGRLDVAVTHAGFDELTKPLPQPDRAARLRRLLYYAERQENVFRLGIGRLGVDVLGYADSDQIERDLPTAMSAPDRDQFLAYVSSKYDYLAVNDRRFWQAQTKERIIDKYGLNVGTSGQCVEYLRATYSLPLSD